MPLSHSSVDSVGKLLGFVFTVFDGQGAPPEDSSDGSIVMSGKAELKLSGHMPPLLIFKGLVPSHHYDIYHKDCKTKKNDTNSVYVLNLNTMKPTQNSWRQLQLPKELITILRAQFNDTGSDKKPSIDETPLSDSR